VRSWVSEVEHRRFCFARSRHQQDEQTTCDYKSAAENDSIVRKLPEETKGNHLGYKEEDRDINPHQAIEPESGVKNNHFRA
jgi:hypothetical protein